MDDKDLGIYYFGIFIRTVERFNRRQQYELDRVRIRSESSTCCVCKSVNTAIHPARGTKIWFKHNGEPICAHCRGRMMRHSEETRRKLSQGKIGSNNPNFGKYGLANPLFGKRIKKLEGANNPKWRGGVTDLNSRIRLCSRSFLWRENAFARNNYTCMRCRDSSGGNLEAHHIKPFYKILADNCISDFETAMACSELWDIDNGITVCEKCRTEIGRGFAW